MQRDLPLRLTLGGAGVALLGYGVFRILDDTNRTNPRGLARWLISAVILNDGILVPTTMVLGFLLTKIFRPRVRRYIQGALISSAMITIVAIPLIYRRGSQPAVKALEQQNYGLHLAILIAIVCAAATLAYALRRFLDGRGDEVKTSNLRPNVAHDPDASSPAAEA